MVSGAPSVGHTISADRCTSPGTGTTVAPPTLTSVKNSFDEYVKGVCADATGPMSTGSPVGLAITPPIDTITPRGTVASAIGAVPAAHTNKVVDLPTILETSINLVPVTITTATPAGHPPSHISNVGRNVTGSNAHGTDLL